MKGRPDRWFLSPPERMPVRARGIPRASGSVLILALWTLFLLGTLALAVGVQVSGGMRLADGLRARVVAENLALAGVELAVTQILNHPTNWNGTADSELGSDESLFRENDSLPGGTFSVTYEYQEAESGSIRTNHGVVRESRKVDLNRDTEDARQRLIGLGIAPDMAGRILSRTEKKKNGLENHGRTEYGAPYESLHEVLAVEGMDGDLYGRLEPHVTVYGGQSYGGMAEGIARGGEQKEEAAIRARCRIRFVFDGGRNQFLYWHEF